MLVHQRAAGAFAPHSHIFAKRQPNLERADDVLRYPILKLEYVVEVALKSVSPDMAAVQAIHQLCRQPHAIAGLANAPFQHIASAENSPDFADVARLSLEHKTRIASYDQQFLNFRQRRQHVFSDAVGEIFLLGIAAHVLERQHRDGRLIRQWRRAFNLGNTRGNSLLAFTRRTHLIGPDWLLNVFHLVNTKVHKGHRQHLAHLIVRGPGDTHGSRVRQCLQPRGYVHSVTKQVSSAHHYVADVDTDAEI